MTRRSLALAASLSIALLACSSTIRSASPDQTGTVQATVPSTSSAAASVTSTQPASPGMGWIGGEPNWHAGAEAAGAAGTAIAPGAALPRGAEPAVDASSTSGTMAASAATAAAAASGVTPDMPAPQAKSPLRAGSVDDNAKFGDYLDYLARYRQLAIPERAFDPTGRIAISVHGANALPAKGVPVIVTADGEVVADLRTDAIGRALFLPATYGVVHATYHLAAAEAAADTTPGNDVDLHIAADGGGAAGMPVDVLFLLDVTGSMGDEIDQLKTTIADVSTRLEQLPQHPDIRFGMTLFRDDGDVFVTSTFDLTGDLAAFQSALNDVVAGGGGDTPEAVDEGFAAALKDPTWRDPATTTQMIFLVGDAAPHVERQLDQAYPQSIHIAAERGITVNVVAASATDDPAEHAFRAIAQGTGGRFVFLAYGAGGAALGPNTDINSTDYEELSLDDLVVRLVGEQLATLTGTPTTTQTTAQTTAPVTTTTVPPTNPPGQ